MKVQDVMTKNICSCEPGTNAAAAAEIMWNENCGALPIVEDGGRLVGIVTDRDLFIALGTRNRKAGDFQVGEILNQDLASCAPGDDLHSALRTMAQRQVQRLPVVDRDGVLKGILSVDDIVLRAEADGLSNEDVLGTIRAICGRQIHRKAGQLQTTESKHAAA